MCLVPFHLSHFILFVPPSCRYLFSPRQIPGKLCTITFLGSVPRSSPSVNALCLCLRLIDIGSSKFLSVQISRRCSVKEKVLPKRHAHIPTPKMHMEYTDEMIMWKPGFLQDQHIPQNSPLAVEDRSIRPRPDPAHTLRLYHFQHRLALLRVQASKPCSVDLWRQRDPLRHRRHRRPIRSSSRVPQGL